MRKTLITVFKTHFDYGFTDLPERVLDVYLEEFIPKAIRLCKESESLGPDHQYCWTLPAYVLHTALKRLDGTVKGKELASLVEKRLIVWHALPFTFHTDLMSPKLLERGFRFSHELGDRFGYHPVSAKMTDVPGHSWFLPSVLMKYNIRFLHIGCNSCSMPPDLPPLFWWEAQDGSRLLTMYSKGGYGSSYTPPEGWEYPVWLDLEHTHDNLGPHTLEELKTLINDVEQDLPDTHLRFGTLDDFANAMLELDLDIPIICSDLSDSWIHGLGSMPEEVSAFRRLDYLLGQEENPDERIIENMLLFAEHTWGLDSKISLPVEMGKRPYKRNLLEKNILEGMYSRLIESWDIKRSYVNKASSLVCKEKGISSIKQPAPGQFMETEIPNNPIVIDNGILKLTISPKDGGITSIRSGSYEYVEKEQVFGKYRYRVYSRNDINCYLKDYGYDLEPWYILDFGKFDYPKGSGFEIPQGKFVGIYKDVKDNCQMVTLSYQSKRQSSRKFGNPEQFTVTIQLKDGVPWFDLFYAFSSKNPTLYLEAGFIDFPLNFTTPHIYFEKGDSIIDPSNDIFRGSSHHIYAAGKWIKIHQGIHSSLIIPIDTPLFSLGQDGISRYAPVPETKHRNRVITNLFNNQWGTNFPQWIGEDITTTFRICVFNQEERAFPYQDLADRGWDELLP